MFTECNWSLVFFLLSVYVPTIFRVSRKRPQNIGLIFVCVCVCMCFFSSIIFRFFFFGLRAIFLYSNLTNSKCGVLIISLAYRYVVYVAQSIRIGWVTIDGLSSNYKLYYFHIQLEIEWTHRLSPRRWFISIWLKKREKVLYQSSLRLTEHCCWLYELGAHIELEK